MIDAIQEQAATLAYANPFMATEPRARLGAKLAEIAPGDIDVFFFTNGGAEANENAIKLARLFTGRHKIMARYRSYHGGTAGAITLHRRSAPLGRRAGHPRRGPHPRLPPLGPTRIRSPSTRACATLEEVIMFEGPQTIAAIIMETVVGHQRHPHPARRLPAGRARDCATSTASCSSPTR